MSQLLMFAAAAVLFLLETYDLLLFLPRIQVLEVRICRDYYSSVGSDLMLAASLTGDESRCKVPRVQSQLAVIRGWQVFFDALPVIMLGSLWGYMADRTSKSLILTINLLGNIIYTAWFFLICLEFDFLPVQLVWLSAIGYSLGGGPRTATALALAIVTDGAQEWQRTKRLYYTYTAFLASELLAPIIGSMAMNVSVWANVTLALFSLCACFVTVLVIGAAHRQRDSEAPATATTRTNFSTSSRSWTTYTRMGDRQETPLPAADQGLVGPVQQRFVLLANYIGNIMRQSGGTATLIWSGFLICPVRQILVFEILIPFTSQRFGLRISEAGFCIPIVACTNLVLFVLVLPRTMQYLQLNREFPVFNANLLIVRVSLAALVLGCIGISLATDLGLFIASIIVFASGFCVRLALLALQTTLIEAGHVGQAFSFVITLEAVGGMVEGLIFQKAFATGIEHGEHWIASPFLLGAAIYFGYLLAVIALQEPKQDQTRQPLRE